MSSTRGCFDAHNNGRGNHARYFGHSEHVDGWSRPGPRRPDEDTRDGFDRGGWAVPYNDDVMAQRMGEGMASSGAMLFGRRTYEDFYGYWPQQTDNPFTPYLNQVTKYVVSNTLSEPLPWQNSILLRGVPAASVAALKEEPGPDLGIVGAPSS